MTDLSPSAQAVFDAFCCEARSEPHHQREAIAAVLRAVVQELKYFGVTEKNILAIAAEIDKLEKSSER
jgi:hypothetical protein